MKKEQKRKILFYGILAGALLLFAACAPMRNAADSSPRFLGECLAEKAAEKSKI